MPYVDGFLVPVPKDKLDAYREMAKLGGDVWMDHGALSYMECVADDVSYGEVTSFPRAVQQKDDETVVLSWVTYESREARDEIMKKVMADPRMKMDPSGFPFDSKRMMFGGFRPIVER